MNPIDEIRTNVTAIIGDDSSDTVVYFHPMSLMGRSMLDEGYQAGYVKLREDDGHLFISVRSSNGIILTECQLNGKYAVGLACSVIDESLTELLADAKPIYS